MYLLEVGDADNNGTVDIVLGSGADVDSRSPQITLYQRSGATWSGGLIVSGSHTYNWIAGMVIGDADNDALNELAYGLHKQGNTDGGPLLLKEWSGTEWSTSTVFEGIGDWSYAHALVDADDDGLNEIAASVDTYGYGRTITKPWLFEYDDGAWPNEQISDFGDETAIPQMVGGDVDGDGVNELIRLKALQRAGAHYVETYSVLDWDGTWVETDITVAPSNAFPTLGRNGTYAMDTGDPDGDSVDEFVIAFWCDTDNDGVQEAGDDSVVVRVVDFKSGAWHSEDIAEYPMAGTTGHFGLAVGDANNDGQDEIYAASEDGVIREFAYIGGAWQEGSVPTSFTGHWYNAAMGDVGDDGTEDLVLVGRSPDGSEFLLASYSKGG
jgi:hypothetical protein